MLFRDLASAEGPVDLDLFRKQSFDSGLVAAAVRFRDLGAEFALAALQPSSLQGVEGALHIR